MRFVNREEELRRLRTWLEQPGPGLALVWGRRRVGKTAILTQLAVGARALFHVASGRPFKEELGVVSLAAKHLSGRRDLAARPFLDWDDFLSWCEEEARTVRLLVILDEFPELLGATPELPGLLRAFWERRSPASRLKLLLCGSAARTMRALQEERAPLFGRFDLALQVRSLRPHDAALMLRGLKPEDRAVVWGLLGGMPLYLERWDPGGTVRDNLLELACRPDSFLAVEGSLVLATEGSAGDIDRQVLFAIAGGKTKYSEIRDLVGADPTRTLERLVEMELIERLAPVTQDPLRTRLKRYRLADNFLRFWLGRLSRYRAQIDRGLGSTIVDVLLEELDDHMGLAWEEAFRDHLRLSAARGDLGDRVVAVGPYWNESSPALEVDALVLAGRSRRVVAAGEAKWSRKADPVRLAAKLGAKVEQLPNRDPEPRLILGVRGVRRKSAAITIVTPGQVFP